MYWKLVEQLEYDYGEYPMSSPHTIAIVMAKTVQDAIFWFETMEKAGYIQILNNIKTDWESHIKQCSAEEYTEFINNIM